MSAVGSAAELLIANRDFRRVTVHRSRSEVAKATRRFRDDSRSRSQSYVLTLGKPNYRDRLRLKKIAKFPHVHVDRWPARRKKR